jgi:site-specific DNA-methyltransferase (adenine-specific)
MSHNKNPTLRPKTGAETVNRKEGSAGLNNPRAGAGRTAKEVYNIHPTVKPVRLMRWLCRLLAPPKDPIILDTFCGSGTTMIAAQLEGVRSIGIEREPQYCDIIRARLLSKIGRNDE